MNRELARKRPAQIIHQEPLPRPEILEADLHNKAALMNQIHTMARRGEIGHTYDVQRTRRGWAVKVIRIAEQPGWWQRNGLKVAGWSAVGLALLTVAVILVRMLVIALAALLPIAVGCVLLMLVASAVIAVSCGGSTIEVLQRVRIRR